MKHWFQKVSLYYLAIWRYRLKHIFRPITFGWNEVAEFFTQATACIVALLIVVLYPISYSLIVIWRASEPLRCAHKVKIENIRKFLEKSQSPPREGETNNPSLKPK